jgi:hypothetical protein
MRRIARWLNIASPMGMFNSVGGFNRAIFMLFVLSFDLALTNTGTVIVAAKCRVFNDCLGSTIGPG